MGGRDDRHTLLNDEIVQQAEDRHRSRGIELTGRLIREDQRWRVGQRAGDGDALLLAAGEFVRPVARPAGEADGFQQFVGPAAALADARAGDA